MFDMNGKGNFFFLALILFWERSVCNQGQNSQHFPES